MNNRFRFTCFVLAVHVIGCAKDQPESKTTNPKPIDATSNLKDQSKRLLDAFIAGDDERYVEFMVPPLIERVGGREKFVQTIKRMRDDLRRRGFQNVGFRFSSSPRTRRSGDSLFAIVPYILDMTGPNERKGTKLAAFIGVSRDGGKSWKFVEAIADDPATLQELVPGFPTDLEIPRQQRATWSKAVKQ